MLIGGQGFGIFVSEICIKHEIYHSNILSNRYFIGSSIITLAIARVNSAPAHKQTIVRFWALGAAPSDFDHSRPPVCLLHSSPFVRNIFTGNSHYAVD